MMNEAIPQIRIKNMMANHILPITINETDEN